ncbi:tRNA-dihydrouridine synthase, partial [Paraburkholderia sp. BR14319]|uniref:tRNA-dihydrouridine synthase n=1 Tax=Paraburkholderia sp. BR14319 TaxID=3237005 RepID=UPI0034D29DE2
YTEMVTTGALIHGDVPRHLAFTPAEAPVALQLGGSEPDDLARDQGAYQIVVWVFEDQRRQITRQSFACRNPSLLGSCELV